MKPQLMRSEDRLHMPPAVVDFTTEVFQHPELLAVCPDRGPSVRDKLIALIAGNVMRDHMVGEQRRQSSERLFTLAAFSRFFGGGRPSDAQVADASTTSPEKSKSLIERMGALAVVIPVLVLLALGAAAWKTNETTSWKNASDGNKELVSVLKEELRVANEDKKTLQGKNDDLQNDIKNLLATAAADSKTDAKSLADSINKLLAKPRPAKTEAPKQVASDATPPVAKP